MVHIAILAADRTHTFQRIRKHKRTIWTTELFISYSRSTDC